MIQARKWAESPALEIPACPPHMETRHHLAIVLAQRAAAYAQAQGASLRAAEARGALEAGSSRARITSANAKWMRAAEHRDRAWRNLELVLDAFGYVEKRSA